MISSLRLVDFKNFADATLRLGPFTVIVGANASGKSNIRDAFRFLHGVGRGYTLAEVLGGRFGSGGQAQWEAIRGAPKEISRLKDIDGGGRFTVSVTLAIRIETTEADAVERRAAYTIEVEIDDDGLGGFRVDREELVVGDEKIYTSHPGHEDPVHAQDDDTHLLLRMAKTGTQRKFGARIAVRPDQPALTQIGEHKHLVRAHKDYAKKVIDVLADMRFLDLAADRMRQPAFPGQTVLGDSGENLPTVLRQICADPKRARDMIGWVRELTPMDVTDLEFPVDPVTGQVRLVIRETDRRRLSAHSVSDGTLRFLAMLAALLTEKSDRVVLFRRIRQRHSPRSTRTAAGSVRGANERQDAGNRHYTCANATDRNERRHVQAYLRHVPARGDGECDSLPGSRTSQRGRIAARAGTGTIARIRLDGDCACLHRGRRGGKAFVNILVIPEEPPAASPRSARSARKISMPSRSGSRTS